MPNRKSLLLFCFFISNAIVAQTRLAGYKAKLRTANDTAYIELCSQIADEYKNQNNVKQAFEYIDSAIIKSGKLKDTKWGGYAHNIEGNLYQYVGDYAAAIDRFDNALKIYRKSGYVDGSMNIYVNKGNTYYYTGDQKRAEQSYLSALSLYPKSRKDELVLANIYNNLGSACGFQQKYTGARNYFLKALNLYKKNKDSASMGYSYNNLGNIELSQGGYAASLPLFQMALDLKNRFGNNDERANAYRNLADVYYNMKNYPAALSNIQECIRLTDTAIYNSNLIYAYTELASVYEAMHQVEQANNYYRLLQDVSAKVTAKEIRDQVEQKEMLSQVTTAHVTDSLRQETHIQLQNAQIERSTTIRYFLLLIVFLVLVFILMIYNRFKQSQHQKAEISRQKHLVDEKQKEILDSISYAEKIQSALLEDSLFDEYSKEHFVLFKPKDIVSGDFYWTSRMQQQTELYYIAVCDSTGHGVPGAFMSILNSGFFNEAVNEKRIVQPNEIFNYIRQRLVKVIGKNKQQDGFDGVLLCIDRVNAKITYAAANNAPVLIRNKELITLPCDKMPVGKGEHVREFSLFEMDIRDNDQLYLFTDGYADQFGGPDGKKFKSKNLKSLLLQLSESPFPGQQGQLDAHLRQWKGAMEQIDDVTIIGLKF